MDLVWLKVNVMLPFNVQSKFDYELMFDHDNGFQALMGYLTEPDRKYEGGMKHKMLKL